MAITLTQTTTPAVAEIVKYKLTGVYTATSKLKLEIDNEDLDVDVPEGETWKVRLEMHIEVT